MRQTPENRPLPLKVRVAHIYTTLSCANELAYDQRCQLLPHAGDDGYSPV